MHYKVMNIANCLDRISFKYALNPLDEAETRKMIAFRVRQAGYKASMDLFLEDAVGEIYQYTRGYPRRIGMLCHKALTQMIMRNKHIVDKVLIQEIVEEESSISWPSESPVLLQKSSCLG